MGHQPDLVAHSDPKRPQTAGIAASRPIQLYLWNLQVFSPWKCNSRRRLKIASSLVGTGVLSRPQQISGRLEAEILEFLALDKGLRPGADGISRRDKSSAGLPVP